MADIKKILSRMTLDEKIGQLVQFDSTVMLKSDIDLTGPQAKVGITKEDVKNLGSILTFKNYKEMVEMQKKHLENDRNKIPLLFMMDVIHGYRTIYPIPLGLACSFDDDLVYDLTRMAAREATAEGINVTFTPMVDYGRDARWGRILETCGEEPLLSARMGVTQVRALQGDDLKNNENMASCVKHFVAYGGAEGGRDYTGVELSEHILREFYFPAHKACIDAGVKLLMPAFQTLNGVPCTANKWSMNKVLRDEWGYKGLVISDYGAVYEMIVHGYAKDAKEAAKAAMDCGCDIEMCSATYFRCLKELIKEGKVTEEQIDKSVLKVLELKDELGLFEDPYRGVSEEREKKNVFTKENRLLARKSVSESSVLLKNDGILPLKKDKQKIALIGPMADEHKIIGWWPCRGQVDETVTIKEGILNNLKDCDLTYVKGCGNLYDDLNKDEFDKAIKAAENSDVVIMCMGEPWDYSGESNCLSDLRLTGVQEDLIDEISKVNKNIVLITFSGRPIVLTNVVSKVSAILHLWFPGTEGGNAVYDMLFGDVSPSGKLTTTFPRATGQCPIYYNRTSTGRPDEGDGKFELFASGYIDVINKPLFNFGYGLSYADFKYESLTLSQDKMTKDDVVKVEIKVTNNSDRDAKETVMLYMRDLFASLVRPVQQLIDYKKAEIKAHETKTFTFEIKEEQLRFYNGDNKFVSEPGDFEISTGYADHLLHTKKLVLE